MHMLSGNLGDSGSQDAYCSIIITHDSLVSSYWTSMVFEPIQSNKVQTNIIEFESPPGLYLAVPPFNLRSVGGTAAAARKRFTIRLQRPTLRKAAHCSWAKPD